MNELGSLLKKTRKEFKLTTSQVAEYVGLSQGYISHIETGRKIPTPDVLQKISKLLKLPYTDLMVKAGYLKSFGQNIKELRLEKGWSLEELERETLNFEYGEPIFIDKATISKLEEGEYKNPSVYEIYLLSNAFDVFPWAFSTFDLQTPQSDLENFLDTTDKPDPIGDMDIIITMLEERLNSNEKVFRNKDEILSEIEEVEKNKKRYIEQLNKLSATGKKFIDDDNERVVNNKENKNFELEQDDEYRFSFKKPFEHISNKELELSFFDIENLLYLDNKVNYKGKILTEEEKQIILSHIADILKLNTNY